MVPVAGDEVPVQVEGYLNAVVAGVFHHHLGRQSLRNPQRYGEVPQVVPA